MKINQNANVSQTGTVDVSGAVQFGFDVTGMAAIAGLLQNMYSDTSLAVLREYFCNAMDSHRAAGVTRPVQVTLPADMNPSLLIQDFGLGLSQQELVTVYSTYGSSTKRHSNEAIGGFGIGSKAAFSMAEQFIVTGVKDGEKTVMLFSLGKAGMGEAVTVSHTFGSTDPNGVIVSIPIRDVAAMERTASTFFTTWRPGTVLVDGDQPASIFDDSFPVGDRFHVAADSTAPGMTLVMGGVGYPVDAAILRLAQQDQGKHVARLAETLGSRHVLVEAIVGDADITPSREALRDTDRTVQYVRDALIEFAATVRNRVINHVADAPTFLEAATRLFAADGVVAFLNWEERKSITWHGQRIEKSITLYVPDCAKLEFKTNSYGQPNGKSAVRSQTELNLSWDEKESLLVVTGVTTDRQWGLIRRKFKSYQTLENHTPRNIVVATRTDEPYSQQWLTWGGPDPLVETISYDEYAARVKNAVIVPAGERGRFTYSAASTMSEATGTTRHTGGLEHLPLAELREATELIWFFQSHLSYGIIAKQVAAAHPDATWVVLTGSQTSSALRKRLPEAVPVDRLLTARAREILDAATPEIKTELLASHASHQIADNYRVRQIVTALEPLTKRVNNQRFLALMADLIGSQRRPSLTEQGAIVAAALGVLNTNAHTEFGDPNTVPVPADKALKAEFPMAAMIASAVNHETHQPQLVSAALDQLVAHLNGQTASI